MDTTLWQRAQDLFIEAIDLHEAERAAFLTRACADAPVLLAEVQTLIDAHQRAGSFIEPIPERIGPYRLLEEIARGGMGVVYRARRDDGRFEHEVAVKLLSLPREVGMHPETGKPIVANIGRFGPYLLHDGKYGRLSSTAELFEVGMNSAVAKLADAANKGGRGASSREPLKVLGKHPRTEAEIKLMAGRYGPYVTDGTTNATLPKTIEQDALTLEEAAQLIDARAAAAPAKKGKKAPAKKAAAKKPAAKKAPAKKKAAAE